MVTASFVLQAGLLADRRVASQSHHHPRAHVAIAAPSFA
jgi:hypothetical protein